MQDGMADGICRADGGDALLAVNIVRLSLYYRVMLPYGAVAISASCWHYRPSLPKNGRVD